MPTLSPATLTRFTERVFTALGAPPAPAARVAEALVDSNLVGHDSHGVIRIPQYVRDIQAGRIIPTAVPEVVHTTPTIATVDGGWAFGQVSALFAIEQAMTRAQTHGLGAATLRHAYHIGRLGEYAE